MSKKPKTNIPTRFLDQVKDARRRLVEVEQVRKSGDIGRAVKLGESLIDDYPDYVAALHTLGLAHMRRNAHWHAVSCFMKAAMLNPGEWTILASLAQAYLGLGANEMAAYTLEQARALKEDDAEIHYTLGLIYDREREYERAAEAFERALALKPGHDQAALSLGGCLVHLGNQEAAGKAFLKCHKTDPTSIGPVAGSAQLAGRYSLFDEEAALSVVAEPPGQDSMSFKAAIAFTRAHVLHRKGEFEAAWNELLTANRFIDQRDPEGRGRHFERREATTRWIDEHKLAAPAGAGDPGLPVSLFIMGVSRSGKTTMERVLATLPGVKRGYENPIIELAVRRASQTAGMLTVSQLLSLPPELGEAFAGNYRKELQVRAEATKVFTNTHPGRITDVGHLAARVPNVRILFVVRDRNDTALRIFMKHFREGGNLYAYDLQSVFREIDWYHNTMAKWQERLPGICRTIRYEQLVEDPQGAVAVAAELCGLEPVDESALQVGDDRGCATPYLKYFADQQVGDGAQPSAAKM